MKRTPKSLYILLAILCFAGLLKATLPQVVIGNWTTTSNLSQARSNSASVLLPDGHFLIIGGDGGSGALSSAEFFGADGTVSAAAAMNVARSRHFAVVMSDGRVLVGGGATTGGGTTNAAEIYDPNAGTWTATGSMTSARENATAAVLRDGRVVVAGGDNSGAPSNTIEIFDPSSGTFNFAGTMSASRTQHAMAVLQDGRVLIAGGFDGTNPLSSSDIFDPVSGNFSAGPNLTSARYAASATTLLNGQVAVIGGAGVDGSGNKTDLSSIEIFDSAAATFSTASVALSTARQGHQAFLLPNNNSVLITGGTSGGAALASAEMLTPQISTSNGTWTYAVTATGAMTAARAATTGAVNQANGPTSIVSPKPGYLIVGGGTDATGATLATTEVYGYPTVQTDQGDYPPGTTVNISGSGFQPNETVIITLIESPLIDTHGPYSVTADANGNVSDSSFTTDAHDLNVRFFLSLVGNQSGGQAQNTFTDSTSIGTVSVVGTQTPSPVAPGGSATYGTTTTNSVDVRFNGNTNGTACVATLGTTVLPPGSSATFSPQTLSSTTGQDLFSLLTVSTTSALVPGSYSFKVTAAGSGGCGGNSTSGIQTLLVVESTNTTLTSSQNPSTFGQSTTLTATVAQVTGPSTPTGGTVTFLDGANTIGSAPLSNGSASISTSALTAGSHSLTASYAGVANTFAASVSSVLTQTVNKANTTTTVSSTSGTANQGSATLNANVTANSPSTALVNEGTVTFTIKHGATTIGTVTSGTVTGGAASANFSLTGVAAGSYSISATYNLAASNPNFNTSTAATAGTLTVNAASTTTTLTSSANPSVFGQSITFTATIAPASGTTAPTGTVQFVVDGSNFGSPVNVAACSPSPDACSTSINSSTLPVGAHSVVANYSGDGNYSASSSTSFTQTVNKAATSAALASTTNPSVFGQSVTFTETITVTSPGSGTIPDGETVAFKDGANQIGTGTTSSGVATFTTSALVVATHSITAVYSADANYLGNTSNTVPQVVNKASTTTAITNDLSAQTMVGQPFSVSVSVSGTAPGFGTFSPGDTVTVNDGTVTCTVTLTAGTGSCNLTPVTAGAKTITATFNGDPNFNTSTSAGAAHTVNRANTTATITSNTPNPATVGQTVTVNYAVAVSAPGAGTPTGNVTVSDGAGDSCTATVAAATCQITFNNAGSFTLVATYSGDTNFNTSASSGTAQTVNPKLAFTSTAFSIIEGSCSSAVTVQAQNNNGSAANQNPARTLNLATSSATGKFFTDAACSTSAVTTATIATGSSTATFYYSDATQGIPTITVGSSGLTSIQQAESIDGLRFGSTAFSIPVNQCSAAIFVQAVDPNPNPVTQSATINLSTTSAGGKFFSDSGCTTQITTTNVAPNIDGGHDSPNFYYRDANAGSPTLTASVGVANETQGETITKLTPTFTVPASQSITYGTASITLSGSIASGSSYPPSGETANITINGIATPATIGANGAFSANIDTHAIPASTTPYSIFYSYAGDANFNAATNTATTLTVNKGTTSTTLVSSLNPSFSGQQVTFTATVTLTAGAGVPSGTVQFQDGGVNLGIAVALTNNGGTFTAQFQTSTLSVATHNITASYSGDANFGGSTSSAVAEVVNSPTTTTSVVSALNPSTYGQSVTFSATVTSASGLTPTGSVIFYDGMCGTTALSSSIALDGSGKASFGTSGLNAGTHNVAACYTPTGSFLGSSGSVSQVVNQATATITVTPYSVTYDGNPHTATGTATGIGTVDLIADLNLVGTMHTSAGDYPNDTWMFHDPSGNYSDASQTIHDAIKQQAVMITIGDPKPTYDGQQHQAAIMVVPGIAVLVTYDGVPFTGSNAPVSAGLHAVSVTVNDANYTGSAVGTLTILQAVLTVTANDKTRAYGAANPAFDGVITGIVNNDPITATYSTTADQSSPVGPYPITPTLSDGGSGVLANYSVISKNGTLTITADALYVISPDNSRIFGGADSGLTPNLQGLVNGDTASSVGNPMCNTVATSASMPGTYAISCSGVTSSNYTPVYINGTLTVTNPLTAITSVQDKGGQTIETLEIGQTDTLTAYGQFVDGHTRALASAGGMSFARADLATPVSGAAIAEAGGMLYAIGGTDGSNQVLNTIQVYNPKTNTWNTIGATLSKARSKAAAASVAERIYIIGGTDASNNPLSSIEVLDVTSGTATISPFSGTLSVARNDAAAVVWNQKLYAIGGSNSTAQSTVDVFDLVLGTTSTTAAGTALDASAATLNNQLYVFGISGGSIQVISFDGTNWSGPSATPLDPSKGVGVVSMSNVLYLVNGTDVWAYDGTNFNKQGNSLANEHDSAQPVAIGSRIYVPSGGSGSPDSKLDAFAPPEVTWAPSGANQADASIDGSGNVTALARTDNASPSYVNLTATSIANSSISGSFELAINRKDQTITLGSLLDKTYGDPDFALSATATSGLTVIFSANGNCTVTSSTVHITGAGMCTVTASQGGDDTTWAPASDVMQSFNINKANATITVTGYSVTYDGNGHTAVGTATGVAGAALTGLDLTGTTHTNAGNYSDTWTFTDSTGNYNNASGSVSDCIKKANASIDVMPYSVTYDGHAHTATITSIIGVNGETGATVGTVDVSNTTHTNAGTYSSDSWSFTGTANYNNIAATTIIDSVAKANAVVVVVPYGVTYDGGSHTATITSITGVNGETGATVGTVDVSNTTHTATGTYSSDSWSLTGTANYNNIGATTITDTINKATALVVVTPYTVTYDANSHMATVTSITGVNGETGATVGTVDVSNSTHTAAGTYSNDSWVFTGTANYNNIAVTTITDTINKRNASVTANPGMKVYGQPDPTFTGTLTNFVPADSVVATYSRTAGETATGGPYTISATLSPTSVLGNYTITYTAATFTITPAPLVVTASSGSMIYGGPVFAVGVLSYNAFVNGDTYAVLTAPPNTSPTCGTYANSASPVGVYGSFCSGTSDPNYSISYLPGSVTVQQASTSTTVAAAPNPATFMQLVTLTATVTPQYSGTPTGSVTFQNTVNGTTTTIAAAVPLGLVNGQAVATFNTSSLQDTYPNNITAAYSGDSNFITSTSTSYVENVQPAPNVILNPMFVSFGNTNVGSTSAGTQIKLTNVGDAALTPINIQITGDDPADFSQINNCPNSLGFAAPNNSCTITVTFSPKATGVRDATLQITDDDDDAVGAQQLVSLSGAGLSSISGASLYTDAIFASANGCGSLTLSGGSSVDSFDSTKGYGSSHIADRGNIGSNGNVTLSGSNSSVDGYALVDSSLTGTCSKSSVTGLTSNGGAIVKDGLMALNGPITYPTPPAPNPAPPTTNWNVTSCPTGMTGCTNTGSKTVSLAPGQYGNVIISGGTTAHLSRGTYNLNSLTLSGKSVLYVDSGPVVVNIAGTSLSGGAPAIDVTGGSIQNPTGIPANLQFTYAGIRGVNLSGGSGSYATVYAPNALVNMSGGSDFFGSIIGSTFTGSGGTTVHYDTSLPDIQAGNYIWFTAVVNNIAGLPKSGQVKLYMTNSLIQYSVNGVPQTPLQVPNAVVTFNSVSSQKTTYDATNSRWSTSIPGSPTGNTFVAGIPILVPAGGFPTGIQNVTWSAAFSTDTPGITLQWQWGAAVYTSFSTTYSALNVNSEDGSANTNGSDPAGTPETYKASVTFGATGGGLTNYTGYLSTGAGVVPTIAPMSVSPSSLDFNGQAQGTTSSVMTAVLSNNDSVTHSFSGGYPQIAGTNAGDITLVSGGANNCTSMTSLASGASCSLYVTFTPIDIGTRTAKVVISDDANNSPQTVYLTGTGQ